MGATRRDLTGALNSSGRGNSGFRRGRLRNILIISEVALSLVLLTGAGLLMRSFFLQRQVNLGFRSENVLTTRLQLPASQYKTPEQQAQFARSLLARIETLPGVVSVAAALAFPPFGGVDTNFEVAGKTHTEEWKGQMVLCSSRFLETLGSQLLKGRALTEADDAGKRKVAVVNQTLARKYFGDQDPIGKQVKLAGLATAPAPVDNPWFEIVGVTSDMKNHGVRDDIVPEAYVPYSFASYGSFELFIRTAGSASAFTKTMQHEVLALDSNVVPQFTNTITDALDLFEFAKPRFGLTLFSVFAAIGLALVTIGVYGVISYTVSQQKHEIGIRMALGATAANVRTLVMGTALRFILAGIGAGLVCAFVVTRLLANQFWGVSPYDPLTVAAVVAILTGVGMTASYLPSRRATRVDPSISLRYE